MRPLALLLALAVVVCAWPVAQAAPTGSGVTVAILDSGVDSSHTELSGRVERMSFDPFVTGVPGLPLDPSANLPDPNGQGTAVASLVAGATLGQAPEARILDLQVSARYTSSQLDPAAEKAAIDAMDYLLQHPGRAQVVLLSFASRGVSAAGASTLAEQARGLREAGALVVVPMAGSSSALQADPAVLTIGAPTNGGCTGSGPGADHARKPDMVAPANSLRAAQAMTATNPNGGGYTTVSGTPYAAAQVAGVAALMLDAHKGLPVDAMAAILRDTAADSGAPGIDDCDGFGLLAPQSAVDGATAWADPLGVYAQPAPGLVVPALALALLAAVAIARRRGA